MKRPKTKTILLISALFIVFLILRFPYSNLRGFIFSKIYKASGITVVADDLYPAFFGWPGVRVTNAHVTVPLGANTLSISAKRMTFRVGLAGIFPPLPAVIAHLDQIEGGGDVYVRIGKGSDRLVVYTNITELNVAEIHYSALEEAPAGKLDLKATIDLNMNDLPQSSGSVDLIGKGLSTPSIFVPMSMNYGFSVPRCSIGEIKGHIPIKAGTIDFSGFTIGNSQSDLSGQFVGDIKLNKNPNATAVNVGMKLYLSDKYRTNPQALTLISFLNTYRYSTPGAYGLKCNASLGDITTRFACAIPEKLPEL